MTDPRIEKTGQIPLAGVVRSVMLRYQAAWCADESPVKLAEKSRRIGLTWAEAGDSVLLAARNRGMDTWYIGYNKDMAQEFIRDCAEWAKHYGCAAGEIEETEEIFRDGDEEKAIFAYVIRFASGWRVTALSSRPSNLRGKQGRVVIDEAAFHEQLGELLKAAMALLMWGGQVHVISTHNGADNPFNELVQEVKAGKKPYSLHTITLDQALADGLYERICLVRGKPWTRADDAKWRAELVAFYGDDADEELFCIPKNSGGKYLSLALIEHRMKAGVPVLRYKCRQGFETLHDQVREQETAAWLKENLQELLKQLDGERDHVSGFDFGRSGDLSVLTPLQIGADLNQRPPFMLELQNVPFRQQEQIYFYVHDRLPRLVSLALDARGNGQFLSEIAMQRYGSMVLQVMLTEKWYGENCPHLKAALEDGTLCDLPRNDDVQRDLRAFEVIKGIPRIPDKRDTGAKGEQRHGDAAISILLGNFAARNRGAPMEFQSSARRAVSFDMADGRNDADFGGGGADLGGFISG